MKRRSVWLALVTALVVLLLWALVEMAPGTTAHEARQASHRGHAAIEGPQGWDVPPRIGTRSSITFTPNFTSFVPLALKAYSPTLEPPQAVVSAAFVYLGAPGGPDSVGWTAEHERGRQMLESEPGVVTTYTQNVGEGAEDVLRGYAAAGWDVVFATSFGLGEATKTVAEEYPEVAFEHCSGAETGENLATYFGRMYQPRYLTGIVAGEMTESDIVGYVASFSFLPEIVRGIDAFALGVREVNPDAQIYVAWSRAWYDPDAEREAAEDLLDAGADVIAQHQDTLAPQEAAKAAGAFSIGYNSDMRPAVGDSVLTSAIWNWGAYYLETVRAVRDGSWTTHDYWGGLDDGVVALADYSPQVPQSVRDTVAAQRQSVFAGGGDVFCGPINDVDGTERVADGVCLTDEELDEIDWFVEGVVSGVP